MNEENEASSIKNKNVIDMAITFSAMNRVFTAGSKQKIAGKLEDSFALLANCDGKKDFEKIHSEFCEWFVKNISTSKKVLKDSEIKTSRAASYGQAAKVFDVALKVYVYYCNLPDFESATNLLPMLHAAVDTLMMRKLKEDYPNEKIKAQTIKGVSKSEYIALQKLVGKNIEEKFNNEIEPVHYDDIVWYWLNRLTQQQPPPSVQV